MIIDRFLKTFSAALCSMILSTTMLSANHHSNPCCNLSHVKTLQKSLGLLRGTVEVTSFTQANAGADITAVTVEPYLGKGYRVTSPTVNYSPNVAGLVSAVVGLDPQIVPFKNIRSFEIVLRIEFDCPFKDAPTVVATLENNAGSLGSQTAFINSFGVVINNVSNTGFDANIYFVTYGLSESDENNLLATVLNSASTPRLNFIVTARQ